MYGGGRGSILLADVVYAIDEVLPSKVVGLYMLCRSPTSGSMNVVIADIFAQE